MDCAWEMMMWTFSIISLIIALAVFIGTKYLVFYIGSVVGGLNPLFAMILIIIVASFVISLIMTSIEFKNSPNGRLHNPLFHRRLITRFLINSITLIIINLLWSL
jgi:hypothetical protein